MNILMYEKFNVDDFNFFFIKIKYNWYLKELNFYKLFLIIGFSCVDCIGLILYGINCFFLLILILENKCFL